MRLKAITLALVVVLSSLTVWVAPVGAAPRDDSFYRPMEITPEMLDVELDTSSIPEDVGSSDEEESDGDGDEASTEAAAVGDVKYFIALNNYEGFYYLKLFQLRAIGEHGEVWVATDLSWPDGDPRSDPVVTDEQIEYVLNEFDETIYPIESDVFGEPDPRDGSESPLAGDGGLFEEGYYTTDGEGRSIILIDNVRDRNYYDPDFPLYIAGFYSPFIQDLTDRNVVTVDAFDWENRLGTPESPWWPEGEDGVENLYEAVFAHEYQHLIHGDIDADETTWLNEGMSDLAEFLVGYGHPMGHVNAFLEAPDNSLVEWEDQGFENVLRDYGHAYMFHLYLYEQYGEEFIENLVRSEANGIVAVEETMAEEGVKGDFYTLYQDFSTALVMDSSKTPKDPRYHFASIDVEVDLDHQVDEANAWGSSYNRVETRGEGPIAGVEVSGVDLLQTEWTVVDDPVDGQPALYAGTGHLVDRFAIVEADLTGVSGATLAFDTRYDIEEGWDYGFVQVSTDGGETWTSLANEHTSTETADGAHPDVVANVPGFTGTSDDWVTEEFDLSAYDGEEVLVAFRYVTDWAVNGEGWYVRNVAIPEAGIAYAGDSTEPFLSLMEVREEFVDYQFTFVGVRGNNAHALQLDARQFDEGDAKALDSFLREGNFEYVVLAVSYAADPGEFGSVGYDYEFTYRETGPDKAEDASGGKSKGGEKGKAKGKSG